MTRWPEIPPCSKCGARKLATNSDAEPMVVCQVCWSSRPEFVFAAAPQPDPGVGELNRVFIGDTAFVRADEAVRQVMALQSEIAALKASEKGNG